MAADPSIRYSLMKAVGAASVAATILEHGGPHPYRVIAEALASLRDGFNGRPLVKPQTCPRGIHRDWWADGDDLDCPWCRIDDLEAARVELSEAS